MPARAGGYVLGVRASSVVAGLAVRRVLEPRFEPGATPPGNLSVLLQADASDRVRLRHGLFVNGVRTVTTTSTERVLAAVWHELDRRDALQAARYPQVAATVLIRNDRAYLLPARVRASVVADQRRWSGDGFTIVDRHNLDLDLRTRTVTVPAPPSERLRAAVEELRAHGVAHRRDPVGAGPGVYRIAEWVLHPGPRTLATRVLEAAAQIDDLRPHGGARAVEAVADLLGSTPDRTWRTLVDLREQLRSVV